jgi:hypothetical protein
LSSKSFFLFHLVDSFGLIAHGPKRQEQPRVNRRSPTRLAI